ncbi:hypothetical protein [Kaistella sp. SH11-4b]|nr:hypothetical protein [Kaistella sp. SH11-4b]MDP2455099.1 hypothetical protein [Kaistella sp. SH11-4b]
MKFKKPGQKVHLHNLKKSKNKSTNDTLAVHIITIIAVFVVAFLIQPFN